MAMSTTTKVINIKDQRPADSVPVLKFDHDAIEAYCAIAGIDLFEVKTLKIRFRDSNGPYGTTKKLGGGSYRVVINIRYSKLALSEGARYVVNNTLLHELRHVAQMQGPVSLSPLYDGWSETEARHYGRKVKGFTESLVAVC